MNEPSERSRKLVADLTGRVRSEAHGRSVHDPDLADERAAAFRALMGHLATLESQVETAREALRELTNVEPAPVAGQLGFRMRAIASKVLQDIEEGGDDD